MLSVSAKIEGGSIKKIEGRDAPWCGTQERDGVGDGGGDLKGNIVVVVGGRGVERCP